MTEPDPSLFHGVEDAVEVIRNGGFVVVVGTPGRRDECALVVAAEHCTPGAVSFMVTQGRGLLFVCLTHDRCEELGLEPVRSGSGHTDAAFMVSIEAREGVSGGVSVTDRARTIRLAADPATAPGELVSPGHVNPLRARRNGVLEREAHPEAAVDLARMAGLAPGAALCGILNGEGSLARPWEMAEFCHAHDVKMLRIADLVEHRRAREQLVERYSTAALPTTYGEFQAVAFRETLGTATHLALVRGDVSGADDVEVFVHTGCLAGDALGSSACSCSERLERSLRALGRAERGVLVYLGHSTGAERTMHSWSGESHGEELPRALRPVVRQVMDGLGVVAGPDFGNGASEA